MGRKGTLVDVELPVQHSCGCSQLCQAVALAFLGSGICSVAAGRVVLSDSPAGSEVAPQRC